MGAGGNAPKAGRGGSHRGRNVALAGGAVVAVLVLVAVGFLVLSSGGGSKALAVSLVPVGSPGPDPFTKSVMTVDAKTAVAYPAKATKAAKLSSGVKASSTTASSGSLHLRPVGGDQHGFYGVDPRTPVADGSKLAGELMANPNVASAWATAMGIDPSSIPDAVNHLTPVLLGADTAVTSHSFVSGRPHAYQAVLEAGTPVFIDAHGTPAVAAASGDPLTKPDLGGGDVDVHGRPWPGYDPGQVIQVTASNKPLTTVEGTNITTGKPATVGVGATVSLDGYLVTDDQGISVVSFDGKKTTQIVDHPVAVAYDDGSGGVVYQELRTPKSGTDSPLDITNVTPTSVDEAAVWHLAAGTSKPTKLFDPGDPTQSFPALLAAGELGGRPVIAYAQIRPQTGDSGRSATAEVSLHLRNLDDGKDTVIDNVTTGPERGLGGVTIGNDTVAWAHYGERNVQWSFRGVDGKSAKNSCTAALSDNPCGSSGALTEAGLLAEPAYSQTGESVTGVQFVDPATGKTVKSLDTQISPYLGEGDFAMWLRATGSKVVLSFQRRGEPSRASVNISSPGKAAIFDFTSGDVTTIGVQGAVSTLRTPIIRPSDSSRAAPQDSTSPTTTVPSTTLPPTTTAPKAVGPLDAQAAQAALLPLSDMPAGWQAKVDDQSDDSSDVDPPECTAAFNALDASTGGTTATVTYSDGSEMESSFTMSITATTPEQAQGTVSDFVAAVSESCSSFTASNGMVSGSMTVVGQPALGDAAATVDVEASAMFVTVEARAVVVAVGANIVVFSASGPYALPIDPSRLMELAAKGVHNVASS